ncbi:hypothetical protein [Paraburkholderia sp. J7]|uniref:hypothetical protein n=1 Tax=Paraburkholderia sp. J7 TaxID=2805438 RepID=UPI002AB7685C|nr:hypothetical protein [Paraburkholderia sp. J7]
MNPESKAIFLHTGYRTAGTWLWSCFRSLDQVTAYYEPLHEMLASIDRDMLNTSTASSWRSGHPDLESPYFAEFAHLLDGEKRGIAGYEAVFSVDSFSGDAPEAAPRLVEYLNTLTHTANAAGRTPVFKFCRSLGRLNWFYETFTDAVHIVVLKNPVTQWQSCWELFARHRNAHFVAIPFAVLDMNRHVPLARKVIEALRVTLPEMPESGTRVTLEARLTFWKQYVAQIDPADAYRGFLAHWLLTLRHAFTSSDAVFDCDLAARSPAYAQAAEQWIAEMSGLNPSLGSVESADGPRQCGFDAMRGLAIHLDALALSKVLVESREISDETHSFWSSKLAQATQVLAFGPDVNWPQGAVSLHRSTRVVNIALIDGIAADAALVSELAATRSALERAKEQVKALKRAPLRRLGTKVRKLFAPKPRRSETYIKKWRSRGN